MPLFYSPEVINIQRHQDELNDIIPRVNNFHIKKGMEYLPYYMLTKPKMIREEKS